MKKIFLLIPLTAMALVFSSCKKSEEFQSAAISDYAPYAVGKYITYNLDSLVYTDFGANVAIRSYQVRYSVEAEITDNLNRPSYRVMRSIRKTVANPWVPDATFEAVNTTNTLEFKENNERYVKLALPIKNGFSWKGNSYIDTHSQNSTVKYLDDWDYMYDSVGVASVVGSYPLDNTIFVNQRDEVIGDPANHNFYFEINQGSEKYAKNIGMVYRHFFHSEFQPPANGLAGFFQGYGITLTMIDHN